MAEVCVLSLCVVGRATAAQLQPAAGGQDPHSSNSHPLPARRRTELLLIYAVSPKFANPGSSMKF